MEPSKSMCFCSLRTARLTVGSDSVEGMEYAESHIILNVLVHPIQGENVYGTADREVVELTISLGPHQIAEIVRHFFWNLTWNDGFMKKILRRLMTARRNLMKANGEDSPFMDYHRSF